MIRLRELTVTRGAARIVEGLTVEICAGVIFWVIGANGAGKSSLLQTIVGLRRPRRGTVEHLLGAGRPALYLRSEMALPPSSTVGDWERLVERLGNRAGWSVRTVLWPRVPRGRRVGRLSTGERKRLLLDPVLRQPGTLVLDEPFAHLSPDAKWDLRGLLEERARRDVVIVATNQDVDRARREVGLLLAAGSATPLERAAGANLGSGHGSDHRRPRS